MPHPDDESLSAALDGEDAAAADHVASCPACRARSDALHTAAIAVGVGAVVPPGLADRAVAASLAAYANERAGGHQVAKVDNVVPLRPVGGGVPDSFSSHRPAAESTTRRVPGWLMGVAAALVAVLVAVPVISSMGDDEGATEVAGRPELDSEASTFAGPPIEGGDLGDQSDQLALGSRIVGALAGPVADESTASAATAPAAGADAADASRATPPEALAAAPAPAQAAPAVTDTAPAADRAGAAGATCEAAVAEEYAPTLGLGPLVYRATLTWQGTPAVLLAYRLADTSSDGADHQAFVMALDGCRLLVVQGF